MPLSEVLMVIAAWCGMSTYSRANANDVNTCREAMLECVGSERIAKSIAFGHSGQHGREVAHKVFVCAKGQKIKD